MNYLSICSGIEAASAAWAGLGWEAVGFSEIEPFPCKALAANNRASRPIHMPDADEEGISADDRKSRAAAIRAVRKLPDHTPGQTIPNLGDMSRWREWPAELLASVDILVGGTPCQAFSVAGLRNSLADERGNLTLTYANILEAIDSARALHGRPPAICLWENVPGVLSTKDNAFGCFLAALAGEHEPLQPPGGKWTDVGYVRGPQRTIAWRILDAQYFGVPQRRRRVFVIAGAGEGFRPEEILLNEEGVRRDHPPSREEGKGVAALTANGVGTCGADDNQAQAGHLIAPAVTAKWAKGSGGPAGDECQNLVTHTQYGEIAGTLTARHDSSPCDDRGQNVVAVSTKPTAYRTSGNCGVWETGEKTDALTTGSDPFSHLLAFSPQGGAASCCPATEAPTTGLPLITSTAFAQNSRDEIRVQGDGEICGALSAEPGMKQTTYLAFETRFARNGRGAPSDVVPPLKAESGSTGKGDGAPCVAFNFNQSAKTRSMGETEELSPTLQTNGKTAAATSSAVRRLTPLECERLQGFPDNHTLLPGSYKPRKGEDHAETVAYLIVHGFTPEEAEQLSGHPDGPRYKACGNSMAVPVMRWLGKRIQSFYKS